MQSKHGKSHKGRREYKINRATSAQEMAEMDAQGWKREHMQFREDGKLDVVYSRIAPAQKPIDKVEAVLVAVGEKLITDSPAIVNKPVDDIRKGLIDKRFGDAFDPEKLIEISNSKIATAIINTANEFYEQVVANQDTSPLGEVA